VPAKTRTFVDFALAHFRDREPVDASPETFLD
jgi:hypothetical protein